METIKITKGDFLKNAGIVGMWNMLLVSDAKQGVNEDFWLDEEEQVLCISGEFAKNADWTDLYFKALQQFIITIPGTTNIKTAISEHFLINILKVAIMSFVKMVNGRHE